MSITLGGPVAFAWEELPLAVTSPLLQGSVGSSHLLNLSNEALQCAQSAPFESAQKLVSLAGQFLVAAWEWDILNPTIAGHLLKLHSMLPVLDEHSLSFATQVSQIQHPANVVEYQYILLKEGNKEALYFLNSMLTREPNQLFWLWHMWLLAMQEGDFSKIEPLLHKTSALPEPIQLGMLGDIALAEGDCLNASSCYLKSMRSFSSLLWRERLGEASFQAKSVDMALAQWDIVLQRRPWHTNLVLKNYDVSRGIHESTSFPTGRGAVLLYTWNKASYLSRSLESLAESELKDTLIVVLNNGSTDKTDEIIKIYEHKLGERLLRIDLPCNIGAPAARNWLLQLPETRSCDWVAFMDDDAICPEDWLYMLGKAMREYPDHPVYGCRVVDKQSPLVLQSTDLHLLEGGECGSMQGGEYGKEPGHIKRFSFSNIQNQCFDFGSFSYMRPCVSVTGCCHLFRREALDAIGHFDVRFSPSQYDDLEHDIRYALQGKWPIYQGHLRVKHDRKSGTEASQQSVAMMSGWANLFKLQTKYTQNEYDTIRKEEYEMLLADILKKSCTRQHSREV